MNGEAPCCGACGRALDVEARGGPQPNKAPLVHAPVQAGVPRGVEVVVVTGQHVGRTFVLDKPEVVVGRTSGADIQIVDSVISRRQCRFVFRNEHVYVEDLGSTCGTYVDDEKVQSAPLRDGSRVHIGNTLLLVRQTR